MIPVFDLSLPLSHNNFTNDPDLYKFNISGSGSPSPSPSGTLLYSSNKKG